MEPYLKAHTMPAVRAGIFKQHVLIDLKVQNLFLEVTIPCIRKKRFAAFFFFKKY